MNAATIVTAFTMGLLGSLHCAGMCGPIILLLPFQQSGLKDKLAGFALYHTGRISMYAALGIAIHSFSAFFHPQWQQYVSVGLGVALLIAGVLSFLNVSRKGIVLPWADFVRKQTRRFLMRNDKGSVFITGALNGLLPCGLVYMALSVAAVSTDLFTTIGAMYAFGLGTVPMLAFITLLKRRLSFVRINFIRTAVPVMLFLFGGLLVVRGMNLGIPYLSPEISTVKTEKTMQCCHKH